MNSLNPHPLVKTIHIPRETHEISLTSEPERYLWEVGKALIWTHQFRELL